MAGEYNAIAANSEYCAMGFVFLWTIVEMNATICDTFVFMHAILVDEEACI